MLAEGVICRESNVADRLVNKRWMQLLAGGPGGSLAGGAPEPPVLASYRHSGDAEPSKVWPITSTCSLSDVEKGTFHLRVDTSTLVALVAAKYTAVEMVGAAQGGAHEAARGSTGPPADSPARALHGKLVASSCGVPSGSWRAAQRGACRCVRCVQHPHACVRLLGPLVDATPSPLAVLVHRALRFLGAFCRGEPAAVLCGRAAGAAVA